MANVSQQILAPRGLALAFTLVIVAFCCRVDNAFTMMLDMQGALPLFLAALCVGALLGCIAVACAPTCARRSRLVSASVGTACCVAGLAVVGFVQSLPLVGCSLSAGALLGFGLACMLYQWWALYAPLPPRALLVTACTSFLLASFVWFMLRHVGSFPVTCFCLVVCALCSGLLFLLSLMSSSKGDDEEGDVRIALVDPSPSRPSSFKLTAAAAAVGMLFNFFTLGLTYWPLSAGLSTDAVTCKPLSYLLVVVALVLVVCRIPSGGPAVKAFSHVALPIAAAIVLASPFVESVVNLGALPLSSSVTYAGIALFNVLGFALPLCALPDDSRAVARVAAAYLAGCLLAMVAGMVVFRLLGQGAQVVSLCIMAAYLAWLVIMSVRGTGDRSLREAALADDAPGSAEDGAFGQVPDKRFAACEQVASSYALSPRETEILQFVARGHGAKYIAERLCISADTVRTHTKRIYEKTGVHARDELLELVEHAE